MDELTVVASLRLSRYRLDQQVREHLRAQLQKDPRLVGDILGQTVLGPRSDDEPDALEAAARDATAGIVLEQLRGPITDDATRGRLADAVAARRGNVAVLLVVVDADHPFATDTDRITDDNPEPAG